MCPARSIVADPQSAQLMTFNCKLQARAHPEAELLTYIPGTHGKQGRPGQLSETVVRMLGTEAFFILLLELRKSKEWAGLEDHLTRIYSPVRGKRQKGELRNGA